MRLGSIFGDNITVQHPSKRLNVSSELTGWGVRLSVLYFLLCFGMVTLVLRLIHLTVFNGSYYRSLAENNRIRQNTIHAPRGSILDRTGAVLVRNVPAFRLRQPCSEDKNKECVTVVTHGEVLKKEAEGGFGQGILETDAIRDYLYPQSFAHVLGFLSEITPEELRDPSFLYQNYVLGDRIGREGVEKNWEKKLRGVDGKELVETDALGKRIRLLGKQQEVPGENITISLDQGLQEVAYTALGSYRGAVVVLKPSTGEVLALVSTPSFDVNHYQKGLTPSEFNALMNDPAKPLFNRAISGLYPPGSTFKLVTATGALEEGAITPQTIVEDTGILRVGQFSFANWYFTQYGKTEGSVDIIRALSRSNDIFFYKTGEALGIEKLAQWGKRLGLGASAGIEIMGEATGVMPDPAWRQKTRGEQWFLGDTYHAAIGQGDLQTTPLQIATLTNIFASGGMQCTPTLEKVNGRTTCKDVKISKKTLDLVKEGMKGACATGGTGWPFFEFAIGNSQENKEASGSGDKKRIEVVCKTGTAEFGHPDNKTYAWFTAFAPAQDPEITVTVLVEEGGEGSSTAGPIAKKVMEEWFSR